MNYMVIAPHFSSLGCIYFRGAIIMRFKCFSNDLLFTNTWTAALMLLCFLSDEFLFTHDFLMTSFQFS